MRNVVSALYLIDKQKRQRHSFRASHVQFLPTVYAFAQELPQHLHFGRQSIALTTGQVKQTGLTQY